MLTAELGAGPLALARAQRAQTARILIETTDLGLAEIAFAAGFGSVRQFNDTILEVYARPPSALREHRPAPAGRTGCGHDQPAAGVPGSAARSGALLEFLAAPGAARSGGSATGHVPPGLAICRTGSATVALTPADRWVSGRRCA